MRTQPHRALTGLATLLGAWALSACVSQDQYSRATSLAEMYQDQVHDLEAENARLQDENDQLNAALRDGVATTLAGADDSEHLARIEELQRKIDQLDRPLGDVEIFQVEGGYVMMIQDKVLFESGSAELGDQGRKTLGELAAQIRSAPYGKIYVRGHTDTDPIKKPATLQKFPKGNLQLSAERAVSVASLLIEGSKIPARDVVVMGFGPWSPMSMDKGPDGKRLNRRVEIFVADEGAR